MIALFAPLLAPFASTLARARRRTGSEERFRDFANLAAEWFWETDAELRFVYFSGDMKSRVGVPDRALLGRTARELRERHGDPDRSSETDALLATMESHRSFDGMDLVHAVHRETRIFSISAHARVDRGGRFVGYRGIGRDVTAERGSLNAARESEDKLRLLVDALPACIAYVDRDMRFRLANETYREWFGVAPASLRGRRFDAVLGEAAFEESRPAIECALQGERVTFEESLLDATGKRRDVQTTVVPHRHGDTVTGLFVLSQDISDQKRRADHLAESRRHLAAVLDGLDAGIVVLDSHTSVLLSNASWRALERELTGRDGGDRHRYGDICARLTLDAPKETRQVIAAVEAHARDAGPAVRADVRCPTPSSERWFAIATSEFLDNGERRVLVVHRDVSERVRLGRRVRTQALTLARTVRLNSLGELAATIAHELNQPLTAIGNYASIARDLAGGDEPPGATLRDTLDKLVAETRRSGAIVHRVSNFVRQHPGERRTVSMDDVIATVASWLQDRVVEGEVRLTIAASAVPASLCVDVTQLEQVLYNLIGNAIEAVADRDDAGGHVWVETAMNDGEDAVVVRVGDDGPGIAPSVRDTLFEPFVTSRDSGLGLGLAICRSIVETHGGRIWHEDAPTRGSVLCFTLPAERRVAVSA